MTELNLSHREKSLVVVTAAVTFVVGFWAGLWSVPPQALDVPLEVAQNSGETVYVPAYRPVPGSLPAVSVVIPLIGFAYAFRDRLVEDTAESGEVPADD
ncbi:hypothetical protein NDI85_01370 [Halomicroarcula sp. S1AR25-4]|uniref:hypothetical protein n=1 Tax=Haloarcula sp. S1AR25-4 TaxID=2950538 RepID=UPI0028743BF9|nr:hypothetical protein [Halomicroarcula sp. S1AR25-4]MDS0276452.1 hypothetical protein [Halomicroarcula sp. S1AR25-4]